MLLELGPCGDGRPSWSARDPRLRSAAGRAAEALGHGGGSTGAAGVRIACLDTRAHQADDTPQHVSRASMDAALDLALGTVDALDAELSAGARAASRPA